MKKFLFCLLVTLSCIGIFAQERIAVFPFENMDNILTRNEMIMFYREFSNEFVRRNAGRFIVVERMEVERLISIETEFQLSVFSAQEKTAEMQRVLNGTQIMQGLIARVDNNIRITISLYTFPELAILPGGATLNVANKNELFSQIPELVQIMTTEIVNNLPPPNPFIGRWRSTVDSNGLVLICILNFNSDGSINVERYDTNRVTERMGGMRYSNDLRRGRGRGTYSIRKNGNAIIADISLTISGVSQEFTVVTTRASFNSSNPNQFTVNFMQCEYYVTERSIEDSYEDFTKM